MTRKRKKVSPFTVLNYLLFIVIGIIMVYPFWYVVMYSFSDPTQSSLSSLYLLPQGFTLESYKYAFSKKILFTGFFNSVFLTVVGTCVNMLLTICLAYPLSRDKLPGKKYFSAFVVFPMLFNGGMIPTYLVIKQFGLMDSLWSLIASLAINVYNLLILSKFFKSIPESLIEATYGRRTRAVIITDSDHVILSAVQPETVANRLNDDDDEEELEEDE